jgi:predicted NBD/HSP70 family sugar kinase
VNLAAMAEARIGAARGVDDFVLIWIARGVGLAVVLGGRLHRGHAGAAGEIGYLPVPGAALPDESKGRHPRVVPGFQRTVSAETVRALARARGFKAASATDALAAVIAAGEDGEPVLGELARRVAVGVAAVCVVLDPALVVLAGEVGRAGGEQLAARVQEQVPGLAPVSPKVVVTQVPNDPVLQGALLTGVAATREEVFASTTG